MAKPTTFAEQMARDGAVREQYIESALERVAALEAALLPLARRADYREGLPEDWGISVPLSELRAAREALDGQLTKDGKP